MSRAPARGRSRRRGSDLYCSHVHGPSGLLSLSRMTYINASKTWESRCVIRARHPFPKSRFGFSSKASAAATRVRHPPKDTVLRDMSRRLGSCQPVHLGKNVVTSESRLIDGVDKHQNKNKTGAVIEKKKEARTQDRKVL